MRNHVMSAAGLLLIATALHLPGQTTTSNHFTRLVALPAPKIIASAEAYPGGGYEAANLTDGETRTEYSSAGKGTNTFVEFDFGAPTLIAGFRHVDRNDPAIVAASELVFSDAGGKVVATVPVAHANKRAGVTFVALPSAVTAQRARWRITEVGPQRHGTVGGAEIAFFTAAQPEPAPRGITLEAKAVPVVEKRKGAPVQPLHVTINYPYVEPLDAMVRVEGLDPQPLRLELGTHSFDAAIPAVQSKKTLKVSVEVARQTVVKSEAKLKPARHLVIYILPHSHVDIGYTELQTDVEKKQMRNLARALEIARATANYPEGARYKWNSEVLWAVESYLRQASPEQQREFIEAVRKGWIGLDAMYGNELTGLCRPEELLRLFRYATEIGQRCGVPVETAMISDVPGYTWGTVQAMAQAGVKYFSIAPNYFDRIGTTLVEWENKPFYWVAEGGSAKVLCWVPYYGYALSHVIRELSEPFLLEMAARFQETGYPYDIACLRWSGHGDNAVPDEQLPESVKAWNAKYAWPKLVIATTAEAFRAFEQRHGLGLPQVNGDWTPYWEDGAGSSARETAMNRASAERLVQAETLWAMLHPSKFPTAEFNEAWRNVLLYSEHTWGAHNSVSQPDLPFVKNQWKIKQGFALDAEAQSQKLLAAALTGGTGAAQESEALDVFNTTSWPRTDLVVVPAELAKIGSLIYDEHFERIPAQRLSSGELVFVAENVPPFAAKRVFIAAGEPFQRGGARAQGAQLENGILTVRVDETTGNITELRTRGVKENLADTRGGALNEYLYLIGADAAKAQRSGPASIRVKEAGPLVASLLIESDAPGCRKLTREIRVIDGLDSVEIINTVDKLAVRQKEGVHFGFAFNVPRGVVRMDVPWAVVRPELDQIPGACKNWFTVQRWVDVANDSSGVTWATVDAPLVEVGRLTANLIGSQKNPKAWLQHLEPSQTIYSWAMNNHWHTNYRAEQEGPTVFRYALRPHRRYDAAEAARFGIARSQPLIAAPARGKSLLPPRLKVEPEDVLVTAFKPSDDGRAWIVRLFGASGKETKATLSWAKPAPKEVCVSDLSERPVQKADGKIAVPAWGIVTLRVESAE